ncbi:MAG: molybdopterin-dependent oxidoreductase [Chloroflexi bacterium]|nr:molybdopterin-dependent oxidoreductase [Chloroflexota bacterium]
MMSAPAQIRPPGILTGILVGILIALPVIAIFFALNALLALPVLPINVMDWLPNNLPNDLLNFGKQTMADVLVALNIGRLDQVAKIAEGIIGTATLFGMIVVAVAAIFVIARSQKGPRAGTLTGLIVGLVLGVLLVLMYTSLPLVQFERANYLLIDSAYIMLMLIGSGLVAGVIYDRLSRLPESSGDAAASAEQLNRRQFLVRVGGSTATLTVAGAVVSLLRSAGSAEPIEEVATIDTPTPTGPVEVVGMSDDFTAAPGTRPEYTPLENHYRIDIVSRPPEIDAATWTLPMVGLVNNPQNFTLDQLREMDAVSQIVTISCISNSIGGDLISTTKWTGVKMQDLIVMADPQPEATYLKITCADGFDEYVNLDLIREDERIILAYAWDDRPLLQKHGFPVRIYIPNHYGMKQPKWITNMEFVPEWEEGYWVRRGWSASALVQTTSVVDTVASDDTFEQDGVTYVPIGGIAYSGSKGISRVEVSIDEGEWVPATLKTPLSELTWVLWRYDWPFAEGAHSFRVRTFDGNGGIQRSEVTPQRPDGATGIHRVTRVL